MTIAAHTEEYAAERADAFERARGVAGRGDVVAKILKSGPADRPNRRGRARAVDANRRRRPRRTADILLGSMTTEVVHSAPELEEAVDRVSLGLERRSACSSSASASPITTSRGIS